MISLGSNWIDPSKYKKLGSSLAHNKPWAAILKSYASLELSFQIVKGLGANPLEPSCFCARVSGCLWKDLSLGDKNILPCQRPNSWKYNFVEVSGDNLEISQIGSLYLWFCLSTKCYIWINLIFSLLIDCFALISETIGMVWFSLRFSSFQSIENGKDVILFR